MGFDVGKAFTLDVSLLELIVRGTVMYFAIFILLRVILRGRTSAVTMSDLIVMVLIADAAQNGMSAQYTSITAGIVLVATIIGCSFLVDWLAFRLPAVRSFVHPAHVTLVQDGRVLRKSLAAELITEGELMTQLRLHEIESLADVKAAYLEGNGEVSVIRRSGA